MRSFQAKPLKPRCDICLKLSHRGEIFVQSWKIGWEFGILTGIYKGAPWYTTSSASTVPFKENEIIGIFPIRRYIPRDLLIGKLNIALNPGGLQKSMKNSSGAISLAFCGCCRVGDSFRWSIFSQSKKINWFLQNFDFCRISTIFVLQKTGIFNSAENYRFSDDFISRAVGCGKEPPQRLKYSRNKGEFTFKTFGS